MMARGVVALPHTGGGREIGRAQSERQGNEVDTARYPTARHSYR